MRVKTPQFENKKDLFNYLKENKKTLAGQKKQGVIFSDIRELGINRIKSDANKSNSEVKEDLDVLRVKVVANTTNFIDSHLDMLLPGAYTKSIQERKEFIPHLHDHKHEIGAKVGEVIDIFTSNLSFAELGLSGSGSAEALVFITDVMKSYNETVFNQYKAGKINQHSIGLRYTKLELAINDKESEKEFDFWEKYINQAINPEKAEEAGYFWIVPEIQLIENSAVLFGANELTPTLDNNLKDIEPSNTDTQKQETTKGHSEQINNLIKNFKF